MSSFLDESLAAYVDASDRYNHVVDETSQLAGKGKHREFSLIAARVRELAVEAEDAHADMLKHRLVESVKLGAIACHFTLG